MHYELFNTSYVPLVQKEQKKIHCVACISVSYIRLDVLKYYGLCVDFFDSFVHLSMKRLIFMPYELTKTSYNHPITG